MNEHIAVPPYLSLAVAHITLASLSPYKGAYIMLFPWWAPLLSTMITFEKLNHKHINFENNIQKHFNRV